MEDLLASAVSFLIGIIARGIASLVDRRNLVRRPPYYLQRLRTMFTISPSQEKKLNKRRARNAIPDILSGED